MLISDPSNINEALRLAHAEIERLRGIIKALLSEVVEYTDHGGADADGCAACAAVNRARAALQPST